MTDVPARSATPFDRTAVRRALLDWYDAEARVLPWRIGPAERRAGVRPDPYRVWLSEVMLQQTTTPHATPYFLSFTKRWPTVSDLAATPDADLMAAWAGLGYYARARNLLACARAVADEHSGVFPDTEAGLRGLPGVGAYTAAAVAAIAFDQAANVVDGNVERVMARLFAIREPLPGARKAIRKAAERITPREDAGDFAQAMMDLGATICTSRDPKCLLCPVSPECRGRAEGDPALLPVKAPKKAKPERTGTAWWIEREGAVWIVTRPGSGMLGGMRALPDDGWNARADGSSVPPVAGAWMEAGAVRHSFTHFHLTLRLRVHAGDAPPPAGKGEWWPVARLEEAGLPTVFARAARLALAG